MVIHYNKVKSGIDIADQLSSYHSAIRKSIRWYHKVADDLIFGTAVVNVYLVQCSLNQKKIKIVDFRIKIVYALLNIPEEEGRARNPRAAKLTNHKLISSSSAYSHFYCHLSH